MKRLLLLALLLAPVHALAMDVASLRNELREAHAGNDGKRMHAAASELLGEFAGHPSYLYYLARAEAMQGRPHEALRVLETILARGVDMLAPAKNDAAFDAVRALPAFGDLEAAAAALHQPMGHAKRAWSFGAADTVPEALALHDDGRVFVGSVRRGEILVRGVDGSVREWSVPGRWSVQGLHLSKDGRVLWTATSAMRETAGVKPEDHGRTALVALDAASGEVLARHELSLDGEHVLGDFLVLDDDTLLATDSIGGGVYALDVATGTFRERVAPGTLRSPQGISRINDAIYIADYSNGLYRLTLSGDSLQRVDDGPASPYGIDGLYAHGNALLAIQNGVRPQQVTRFELSKDGMQINGRETLLANHPDFDEPTLGELRGDVFYLVANSHWNRFDREGVLAGEGLESPVILSLPLSRMSEQ